MRVTPLILFLQTAWPAHGQNQCKAAQTKSEQVKVEASNKAAVFRFHDALNRQDWATMQGMVSPDYRHLVPSADGFRTLDWATFKRGNAHVRMAFPDWKNEIIQSVAEGDKVVVLIRGSGTHRGSVTGEKATSRTVTLPIMIMHQVCHGKLISDWEMVDVEPMMARLKAP